MKPPAGSVHHTVEVLQRTQRNGLQGTVLNRLHIVGSFRAAAEVKTGGDGNRLHLQCRGCSVASGHFLRVRGGLWQVVSVTDVNLDRTEIQIVATEVKDRDYVCENNDPAALGTPCQTPRN